VLQKWRPLEELNRQSVDHRRCGAGADQAAFSTGVHPDLSILPSGRPRCHLDCDAVAFASTFRMPFEAASILLLTFAQSTCGFNGDPVGHAAHAPDRLPNLVLGRGAPENQLKSPA